MVEVEVNPDHIVSELDYTNNISRATVRLDDDPSFCMPVEEIRRFMHAY